IHFEEEQYQMRYISPVLLHLSTFPGHGICTTGSSAFNSTPYYWDCNAGSNISAAQPGGYNCIDGADNDWGARQCKSGAATNTGAAANMCSSGGVPGGLTEDCSTGLGVA
ncbi:MAG: hypothetical protein JW843_08625, partial [Candidatus Aminicenantes bacterium]|nr:hypothetical protein [Candidatus Aminicenantes bacterium]